VEIISTILASGVVKWGLIALLGITIIFGFKWIARIFGVVYVPEDSIGTVTKKFVLFGTHKELPQGKIIALNGEAGFQADTLTPGLHWLYWPWQYSINLAKFTIIPQGKIGIVESCDGEVLPDGRIVGRDVDCDNFQDARAFLTNKGQRGPQMGIIAPGTWRINTLVFTIKLDDMTVIELYCGSP
jgi:uncharacterized membrane protein YqiK